MIHTDVRDTEEETMERDSDVRDPSRSIVLDLQEFSEWQTDSTVKIALFDPAKVTGC